MDPQSLFSLNDHLKALSAHGDPLEVLGKRSGSPVGLKIPGHEVFEL